MRTAGPRVSCQQGLHGADRRPQRLPGAGQRQQDGRLRQVQATVQLKTSETTIVCLNSVTFISIFIF